MSDPFDQLRARHDFVLFAVTYPHGWRTGSEFVRQRVRAYAAAGLEGVVVDYSPLNVESARWQPEDDAPVLSIRADQLASAIDAAVAGGSALLAHSPTPVAIDELRARVPGGRLAIWFHGYEVRDYRRLHGNTDTHTLTAIRHIRDGQNRDRFKAAAPLFADPAITKVFVSATQRRHSEFDVGIPATNTRIIPNFIDDDTYRARVRQPGEERRILLLRSFATHNYAGDIAVKALDLCSRRDGFSDLAITIRGYGALFREAVADVRRFDNVTVTEGFSSTAQMAALYDAHGVALVPTRYDTQGVMLGEAMASGAVTITNPVAAIPEFTDAKSSLVPRGNDPRAFADAIWHLIGHPEVMPKMSTAAAERVRAQCGRDQTIGLELELIKELSA
ncbi:Glycosyltransferase involved in cell wall bisynthesis [Tessaracoccus bendigoensis DSM 12906]|uniref:Glycosyltransferase involved in cell wall bisynthesis n=1 Tax=Tessaracoccus bendigoensis DSM 12906 TaxID=1123357 RepID=A0A1M6DIW1_9ACTN|nr:glycosyltransferase family 4 protein [Tessaracoccus bendigoensis]SHI73071.1 Glycosyltransferase involved in cell wall bisynthesis [Tessaracoccus bendigoensis DSM 12906]